MFKPINGWTKELIINAIMKGNKGTVSIDDKSCAYRGNGGNACAVGCFIPDEIYHPSCEGRAVSTLLDLNTYMAGFSGLLDFMPLEVTALEALQEIHDSHSPDSLNTNKDPRPELIKWINENVTD